MQTSTVTTKGQVTIPADVRRRLGLRSGDHIGFILDGDNVRLVRQESRIEAAFGICKPSVSVSLEDIDQIIKRKAGS